MVDKFRVSSFFRPTERKSKDEYSGRKNLEEELSYITLRRENVLGIWEVIRLKNRKVCMIFFLVSLDECKRKIKMNTTKEGI